MNLNSWLLHWTVATSVMANQEPGHGAPPPSAPPPALPCRGEGAAGAGRPAWECPKAPGQISYLPGSPLGQVTGPRGPRWGAWEEPLGPACLREPSWGDPAADGSRGTRNVTGNHWGAELFPGPPPRPPWGPATPLTAGARTGEQLAEERNPTLPSGRSAAHSALRSPPCAPAAPTPGLQQAGGGTWKTPPSVVRVTLAHSETTPDRPEVPHSSWALGAGLFPGPRWAWV